MNYTQLQAQVATWLNRTDLTAVIPDFLSLAEEKINRHLRVRQMETDLALTAITSNIITPASTIVDVKSIWLDGYEGTPLIQQSFESVLANGLTGLPTAYAWKGLDLYFNGAGSVRGVLYERIPELATATTNWLSESAPSLYLFGAMAEAKLFIEADPSVWLGRFDATLNELNGNDQRRPGALVARAR